MQSGFVWLMLAIVAQASAQEQQPRPTVARSSPLTIEQAVLLARDNYPALQEQRARAAAAAEGPAVAHTAYLPRLDAVWQENLATHNNVFGLLLPQAIIPSVSGPVLPRSSDSVWGSAAGLLLSWDVVDFGVRKANVDVAKAQQTAATANLTLSELDATAAAADAFLTVLAADAGQRAAQANVDRLQVLADAVRILVANQLRPGADQSRAEAELAVARNQLIQSQQAVDLAHITLAASVGRPGDRIAVVAGRLTDAVPSPPPPATPEAHPAARVAAASIGVVQARERALGHAALPHISFQSAASARGSGATVAGIEDTNTQWLRVPNWAVGLSVSFPLMEGIAVRPRRRVEAQNEVAARAAYDQTILTVTTAQARAATLYRAATAIAQNMSTVLSAARETQERARARYSSGLAPVTEVADAERLLAQAESDAAVAQLGVWRALLAQAQASGDLTRFLNLARRP